MRTSIVLVAVLALLAPGALAQRKPKPPEVAPTYAIPSGAGPGAAVKVEFVNAPEGDVVGVWTSFPAAFGDGRLTPGADAPVGVGAMRVLTTGGVSGLQFFMIDDLETVAASGKNTAAGQAQVVPTLTAVEGAAEPLASHFYRFQAKAGQRVAFEVVAQRLGFRTDPMIRLTDSAGRELAYCDDTPGLGGDIRLAHTFEKGGDYLIELRDANYGGGPEYRYRLRIGDFPVVTVPFPLAGKRGAEHSFALDGLPDVAVKIPADAQRATFGVKYAGGRSSGFVSVLGADAADVLGGGEGSLKIELPVAVSGRFRTPGQRHVYAFDAKKGDRVAFRGQTRSLQSACDLSLVCLKPDGGRLGESKSGEAKPGEPGRPAGAAPDEGTLEVTIPADGTYSLVVEDLNRAGGPEVVYRLVARRGGDFSLGVDDDAFDVAPGRVWKIKVKAAREGYNEAITLALTGDAATFPLKGKTIAKGKNETELQITVPDEAGAAKRPLSFTIVGTGSIDGADVVRTASTTAAIRKQFPRFLFVPPEFDGLIGLGVRK